MDQLLTNYLDAEEAVARGDYCSGCGAAWHPVQRKFFTPRRGPTSHSLHSPSSSMAWELRHELECPYRRGFADAHLGRLVGELLKEMGSLGDFLDDPITVHYGVGSEMTPLVWEGIERRCEAILARYGVTLEQLLHMIDERCSPKWTYFSGLNHLRNEG